MHNSVVEVVQFDVSRINSEGVLALMLFFSPVVKSLISLGLKNLPPVLLFCGVSSRLEIGESLGVKGELTKLHNMRFRGKLLDCLELRFKCFGSHLGSIGVLQPVDGEKISKASSDGFSIDLVVWGAVGSPRRFLTVGSSDGVDVHI